MARFLDHCLRYPSAALRPCLAFVLSPIPRLGVGARTLDARQSHDSYRVLMSPCVKGLLRTIQWFRSSGRSCGVEGQATPRELVFCKLLGKQSTGTEAHSLVGITSLAVMSRIEQQSLSEILLFRTKCVPQPRSLTSLTDWIRAGSFGTTTGSDGICGCS